MSEREFAVIGPPGTGKTTFLSRQAKNAVKKHGPSGVLVCSLTKAAAREAAGRDSGLDPEQIGTLHAHCYRLVGRPTIVEDKHIDSWNEENPQFRLSKSSKGKSLAVARDAGASPDDEEKVTPGDQLLQMVELYRSRMVPRELWITDALGFERRWKEWKNSNNLADFTDLIERALENYPLAPGSPGIIFADEAQDHSKLEVTLIRKWANSIESLILVGDPDQALFHWRGADQEIFSEEHIQKENFRTLSQSYRVPQAVHAQAIELIQRIPGRRKIEYKPTEHQGEVIRTGIGYNRFDWYISLIEDLIRDKKRVMLLCSCEFMLRPIIRALRENGIPYHNPYADRWNPLRVSRGISMRQRLLAFLKQCDEVIGVENIQPWTRADIKHFASCLRSEGVLWRGAKTWLERIEDNDTRTGIDASSLLSTVFLPEALRELTAPSVEWFQEHLMPKEAESARFSLSILEKRGIEALKEIPQVCVGTIHSVKGGESEAVIVFPDLSPRGYENLRTPGWTGHDAVIRMFYVAFTRAIEHLYIASPSSGMYIPL